MSTYGSQNRLESQGWQYKVISPPISSWKRTFLFGTTFSFRKNFSFWQKVSLFGKKFMFGRELHFERMSPFDRIFPFGRTFLLLAEYFISWRHDTCDAKSR